MLRSSTVPVAPLGRACETFLRVTISPQAHPSGKIKTATFDSSGGVRMRAPPSECLPLVSKSHRHSYLIRRPSVSSDMATR